MTAANKAIKREKYQLPTVEQIIHKARGMQYFNKIDLKSAFQQIELHPSCRYISRFRTMDHIYQYKRLFFGVSSASEQFHHIIAERFSDLPATQNAIDDILTMGRTEQESFENTRKVLQRLSDLGLTVNPEKCKFNQREIVFFGLKLSSTGVSLNDQKTEALKNAAKPETESELHNFLGLANYASRWIKDLATISAPLWALTRKNTRWNWTSQHQEAFDKIKASIMKSIGYYDPTWDTCLTVDASPVGISGVLTQSNPRHRDEKKIIHCISRNLTETEKRYSQLEKEALAPPWAMERLYIYLLGKKFTLCTDNRAVALIYNNPLSKPPMRILRSQLRLAPFQFVVENIKGKGNIADFLSRYPNASVRSDLL